MADLYRLSEIIHIFERIVSGVHELPQPRCGAPRSKPRNICLRLRGSEIEVKLIDLGLADFSEAGQHLRIGRGAPSALWTSFMPPEFKLSGRSESRLSPRSSPGISGGHLGPNEIPKLEVASGDSVRFKEDQELRRVRYRVAEVRHAEGGGLRIIAEAEPGSRAPALAARDATPRAVKVVVDAHCGWRVTSTRLA